MSKRSRFEIYIDLLKVVSKTHKPTLIMYRSNLSWNPTKKYLDDLVKLGLVREENTGRKLSKKHYYLTEKGMMVLTYFKKLEADFPFLFL